MRSLAQKHFGRSAAAHYGERAQVLGQSYVNVYLILVGIALTIAGLSDAALSVDGSTYLYGILEDGAPHAPNSRLINVLIQLPVWVLSRYSDNLDLLRAVFGLSYAAIPLLALGLSWRIVRRRSPKLFVWPAISICLATLPVQFYLGSEAVFVAQLAWPVVLAMVVGVVGWDAVIVGGVAICIVFCHPFGFMLLLLCALVAYTRGWIAPDVAHSSWYWALGLHLCAIVTLTQFITRGSASESELISLDIVIREFRVSVVGAPLIATALAWGIVILVFQLPKKRVFGQSITRALAGAEVLLIFGVGLLLSLWAVDMSQWAWISGSRSFALFNSLGLMAVAAFEGLRRSSRREQITEWSHRSMSICASAFVYLVVLVLQSIVWRQFSLALRDAVADSGWGCSSLPSMNWVSDKPISWAAPLYALLLQERSPRGILLPMDDCAAAVNGSEILLSPYTIRTWDTGWFDLTAVRRQLIKAEEGDPPCWYAMSSSWYAAQGKDSSYWWRWNPGRGDIRVVLGASTDAVISGAIESAEYPDRIEVVANGVPVGWITVSWPKMGEFATSPFYLHSGVNTISLESESPSISLSDGDQKLGFAVANLHVVTVTPDITCALHP